MYIFDNLIVNCLFQGAPKEEILRCSVADDNTFSDNVFLNKQLTNEAEKDFKAVKVELSSLSTSQCLTRPNTAQASSPTRRFDNDQ